MVHFTIACMSCGQQWQVANAFSVYEQQTVESCPCPHCGAYTLSVHKPEELTGADKTRVRSAFAS